MNPIELLSILQSENPEVKEIPFPAPREGMLAHEPKPFRDAYLYVSCPCEKWLDLATFLKEDPRLAFDFLTMVTAIDYAKPLGTEGVHIQVVYHLFSLKHRHRLVLKVSVPRDNGVVPSVMALWPTADWQEREVYDMFGVRFKDHPNCTRILMWEGFSGWPLKKDYVHIPDRYDD